MNNIARSFFTIAASLAALLTAGAAQAANAPEYVRVRGINYAGSGCPAGSVAQNISPDRQALTLLFDEYVAEVGPGLPLSLSRKNCQILVDLDFPQGWTYTIATVDYRGFVSLDRNVTATQASSYYFQGQGSTGTLQTTLVGPVIRDFQIRDTLGLSAEVWSPCGAQRALIINSQVRTENARNRVGSGLIANDSIDLGLKHIYGIKWQRCR